MEPDNDHTQHFYEQLVMRLSCAQEMCIFQCYRLGTFLLTPKGNQGVAYEDVWKIWKNMKIFSKNKKGN